MSDEITNPLYGKFDEVVDALVKPKDSGEEEDAGSVEGGAVREQGGEGYGEKHGKRSRKFMRRPKG